MLVAFMGNDGSGKTTVINLLRDKFKLCGRDIEYVPGFSHLFMDGLKAMFHRIFKIDMVRLQVDYEKPVAIKKNILFYFWPYFVFMDSVALFVKYRFFVKNIVLFDRYFYDYIISFRNLGTNTWLEEFLFFLIPKPKYSYIFDVDPSIAYERKKETHKGDLSYYQQQRLRYVWLAKRKGIKLINTDNNKPEIIVNEIYSQIMGNGKI